MKNFKKWMALLMACLLLLAVVGCGKDEPEPKEEENQNPVTEQQKEPLKPSGNKLEGKKEETEKPEEEPEEKPEEKPEEQKPEQPAVSEDPVLAELRREIVNNNALFGAAYLGYAELPGWHDVCVYVEANGYADKFPFLLSVMEDHAALQEGGEVYAIVPASKDVTLTVSEYIMDDSDDYIPDRGADLVTVTDGMPLLLRGNISEIVPNLRIIAQKKGSDAVLEYSPCLSGMDGSLVADVGIYDFTPYELLMGNPNGGFDPVPEAVYTLNTWYAQQVNGRGELLAMTLNLNADGTMDYSCGWPYSGVFERFEGTWTDDGQQMVLMMTGGSVDDLGNPIAGQQHTTATTVAWDMDESALVLHHVDGAPLLYGTEDAYYTFMPFDGHHMVNVWENELEGSKWEYQLQLFENGTAILAIRDQNHTSLAVYEGWWGLTGDSMLNLNLLLASGQHPESPELDYMSGSYLVEEWSPYSMKLSYLYGDILTLEMEAEGSAVFSGY